MKKITIALDEEVANWARTTAAQHNMSVSRLVGEMLAKRMQESSEYDRAKRAWLARSPGDLGSPKKAYPRRDELHDRRR
jgi:hypothetical protein